MKWVVIVKMIRFMFQSSIKRRESNGSIHTSSNTREWKSLEQYQDSPRTLLTHGNYSQEVAHNDSNDEDVASSLDSFKSTMSGLGDDNTTVYNNRQAKIWRRKTLKLLTSPLASDSEQARRAGHLAADYFWKLATQQEEQNSLVSSSSNSSRKMSLEFLWNPSYLLDLASVESFVNEEEEQHSLLSLRKDEEQQTVDRTLFTDKSSERAMLRGIRRGKREDNEQKPLKKKNTKGKPRTRFLTTEAITGRKLSPTSPPFLLELKAYFGSHDEDHRLEDDDEDGDAWMCGVCGKVYVTLEAADKHEQEHIREVVQSLPWKKTDSEHRPGSNKSSPKTGRVENKPREEQKQPQAFHFNTPIGNTPANRPNSSQPNPRFRTLDKIPEGDWESSSFYVGDSFTIKGKANSHFPDDLPVEPLSNELIDEVLGGPDHLSNDFTGQALPEQPKKPAKGFYESPMNGKGHESPLNVKPRSRASSRLFQQDRHRSVPDRIYSKRDDAEHEEALVTSALRDGVILADEALVEVCEKANKLILGPDEISAERQLACLARDKAYYDELARRSEYRKHPYHRHRKEGHNITSKIQNKLLDAYQLCKEGTDKGGFRDEYNMRAKKNRKTDGVQDQTLVVHNLNTLYLNVMVKNGIEVVKNELERLAKERWESAQDLEKYNTFERFRIYAHMNLVRFAKLALSSDFTPRRIAVKLSNDIYRLLTPRLHRRGVTIETEIEYRVGPYFVLAVNFLAIDWKRLLKATHRDIRIRNDRWRQSQEQGEEGEQTPKRKSTFVKLTDFFKHVFSLTRHDIVAQFLYVLYDRTHWIVYQPFCVFCYYTFFGALIRQFILSSVADEIFYYVEEKGMEMEISVRSAALQTSFMLSALREIRAGSKDREKQKGATTEGGLLGPLLGPAVPADKIAPTIPPGFVVPEHLEFLGLDLDVPVGFRRLRWAFLSSESNFITEAVWRVASKFDNITRGEWNRHNQYIGSTKKLPDDVKEEDFVGAEKECAYLMPKSAFVSALMAYSTQYILAYNDYCFSIKTKTLTPTAPYGSTFVAWVQQTVINTGNDTCRLQFSVEPEFPNGPPMVSRQIKSGMRAGTCEGFVLQGETIAKYADEFP